MEKKQENGRPIMRMGNYLELETIQMGKEQENGNFIMRMEY